MNPYAPPEAKLADMPAEAGSPIKAVTFGLLVDLGGTVLATLVLAFVYGIALAVSGASAEEIAAAADPAATDTAFFYGSILIGLGFSALGGFVCARIARRDETMLGGILAALSAFIGWVLAGDQYELGTVLSLTLASIGAVLIGARLGGAKNRGIR